MNDFQSKMPNDRFKQKAVEFLESSLHLEKTLKSKLENLRNSSQQLITYFKAENEGIEKLFILLNDFSFSIAKERLKLKIKPKSAFNLLNKF